MASTYALVGRLAAMVQKNEHGIGVFPIVSQRLTARRPRSARRLTGQSNRQAGIAHARTRRGLHVAGVLVRSGQEPVVVNPDIAPVEPPEEVLWKDPIHR
jgi:hypothetical protein